jgi:hypothetical protein
MPDLGVALDKGDLLLRRSIDHQIGGAVPESWVASTIAKVVPVHDMQHLVRNDAHVDACVSH